MLDSLNEQLFVFTGGHYHINTAKHTEATNISAPATSIHVEKSPDVLIITHEGGRIITLTFGLKLMCTKVSAISQTFRNMMPAEAYAGYLTKLIKLFKAEKGDMFEIFAYNFSYLIGFIEKMTNQQKSAATTAL